MLSPETISTVKATAPVLEARGLEITQLFYKKLFAGNPELLNIFNHNNQGNDTQARALADAVLAYARNLDNVEVLLPTVARIANKHTSLGVKAEHYPIVGKALLETLQELLDLDASDPIIKAWAEAYGVLADVFVNTEEGLYQHSEKASGGWRGFRDFEVTSVIQEAAEVRSFYLAPVDGKGLLPFLPGQYIGVSVQPKTSDNAAIRQYSLTGELGAEHYRITVKTEPNGCVSNHMHQLKAGDRVDVSPPAGVFTARPSAKQRVFIAGGVGITPVYSMLLQTLSEGAQSPLFIQCCRDASHQIYADELAELKAEHNFDFKLAYENGEGADWQGYLDAEVLQRWLTDPKNVDVYFCGPMPFMKAINKALLEIAVPEDSIFYEVFGPNESL
jgi:nitric oxide dioxygenase